MLVSVQWVECVAMGPSIHFHGPDLLEAAVGLSETIVAAIIGASANVSAAGFQLMRARSPASAKPRRSALRTALTLVALVLASAVGGYAWSELRAEGAQDEIARLRTGMHEQLQALVAERERHAMADQPLPQVAASEALVKLAPCVRNAAEGDGPAPVCNPAATAPVMLCTQIPATAERLDVERYARSLEAGADWRLHTDEADAQTIDMSFADVPADYAAPTDLLPVCVNVSNRNPAYAQVARLVVRYRTRQAVLQPSIASR